MAQEKESQTPRTGIEPCGEPRWHFDLYAVLEGAQELYFGHEMQINVSLVETVEIRATDGNALTKCYISPTKRRGVERRCLIWAPVQGGALLGDKLGCGIPETCTKPTCPICSVYGGLKTGQETLVGRLVHGGGVAVQDQDAVEKQRAMHPARVHKGTGDDPMPFRRQYNQPGLLYPVYNHCLSVTEGEFAAVAYAFLDSLARLGAGNPKGVRIYDGDERFMNGEPMIVLDRYLVPLGKRPVISPSITDPSKALQRFEEAARNVGCEVQDSTTVERDVFIRWIGHDALRQLQGYARRFAATHLVG